MTHLYVDEERIGGWIFVSTKGTSTTTFGPFEDYDDLKMWLETIGDENEIGGTAVALVNPASDPSRFSNPLYRIVEAAQ